MTSGVDEEGDDAIVDMLSGDTESKNRRIQVSVETL